jgi:hypothetical protein
MCRRQFALSGYGTNRPLIVLKKHSPGFQQPDSADKGQESRAGPSLQSMSLIAELVQELLDSFG